MKRIFIAALLIGFMLGATAQPYNDTLDVVHYGINLKIDINHKFIKGFTDLKITAKQPLKHINLGLWGLFTDSVLVNGQRIDNVRIRTESIDFDYDLNPGDTVLVRVYYHGNPVADPFWGGFHFSGIDAYNYGIGMESHPVSVGRVWFPANDVFTDKATYDFRITVDTGLIAVCNGVLIDTSYFFEQKHLKTKIFDKKSGQYKDFDTVLAKPYITYHWRLDLPVPTYLASVGVSKYKEWKHTYYGENRDIPVWIYLLPSTPLKDTASFANLDKVLALYERLFGPYRWPRVGYLQTTSGYGAMEHATNIALSRDAIDGTTKNQDLYFHELSHSWFGNLVTCKTREDVWLNEGWANYMEGIYREFLQDEKSFRNWRREQHLMTLNFAHKRDGGYKAIGKIDFDHTYGATVYDKGADVVHTLRYQLGDSVFWTVIREYLDSFAFSNVSIREFQHFLERRTGQDLQGFFDYWLYTSGFPYFEIYYFETVKTGRKRYKTAVTVRQRTIGSDTMIYGQKLQIALLGEKGQFATHTLTVAGQWTYDTVVTDFKPVAVIADPNEYVADATTDQLQHIDSPGNYYYDYELFEMYVRKVKRPAIVRVQANWLPPDGEFPQGYIAQSNYFWTVETNATDGLEAEGKFYLTTLMDLNFTHITEKDLPRLVMFYRPNPYSKWQIIPSKIAPESNALIVENLSPGQYVLGLKR